MSAIRRMDAEQGWAAAVLVTLAGLIGGVLAFPGAVWDRFLWQYLWGPVFADANNAECVVLEDGSRELYYSSEACANLASQGLIVSEPGYTLVSEVVYAVTLVVALIGVLFMLRRFDIGDSPEFLLGLLPFMFFGGALRVVEDAVDSAAGADATIPIAYPWNTFLISPVIYFTVFVVTLAALFASLYLSREGRIESYERGLIAAGSGVLVLTLAALGWFAVTTDYVGFYPQISVIVLAGAGVLTLGTYRWIERNHPELHRGTGAIGLAVLFAHSVDGVANVVGIDWGGELGLPYGNNGDLVPKHPINDAMISLGGGISSTVADLTGGAIVPASVIGQAWPFLLLKIGAAVGVIWLFDETIFEESPRYAILLLIAIVAVGLGPGTRDMLRATFGI
jgi:uncharacterized membrane protein